MSGERSELGFRIENRAGLRVLVYDSGSCHPASIAECALWDALSRVLGEPTAEQERYSSEDMRKQGLAGRSIEKAELLSYLRSEADGWRAGVPRDGSIKGHHLPLKHVYRWLDAIERGEHTEGTDGE
jgi:hypothetical protein